MRITLTRLQVLALAGIVACIILNPVGALLAVLLTAALIA